MKKISQNNLNAFLANQKIDEAITKAGETTNNKTVHLAKVILRNSPTHKLKNNVPLLAFVKDVGDKLAIKVLTSNLVVLLSDLHIASVSEIHGDFHLDGVTYGIKDTINGFPRYKVKRAEKMYDD